MSPENVQEESAPERSPAPFRVRSARTGPARPFDHFPATVDKDAASAPPANGIVAFKFGGSSLLGAERMLHAAGLARRAARSSSVAVVVSAMKGVTDHLLSIACALSDGKLTRARQEAEVVLNLHLDVLHDLHLGEGHDLRVRRELQLLGREILLPLLHEGIVPVVTGFIGATPDGRITTLGRNSSDFSGAIIAHVIDADELVIWTDVDGIYTANPSESGEARLLHELSYDEAHALAASGAKVLHAKVLPLAAETEMVIWIRNTFNPQARGTRIGPDHGTPSPSQVRGAV